MTDQASDFNPYSPTAPTDPIYVAKDDPEPARYELSFLDVFAATMLFTILIVAIFGHDLLSSI